MRKNLIMTDFRQICWLCRKNCPLQKSANIMQIQIHNQADANFPVQISVVNVIALCNMGTHMRCMLYVCYLKLKHPPSLKMVPTMSVHSALVYTLCPVELTCCEVTIGKSQLKHTFIVCKKIKKELFIGLDMQKLYHLGCDWTDNGQMIWNQRYWHTHYFHRCC